MLTKEEKRIRKNESKKRMYKNNPEKYTKEYFNSLQKKVYKNNSEKYTKEYWYNKTKKSKNKKPEKYTKEYSAEIFKKCIKNNLKKYTREYFNNISNESKNKKPEKYTKEYLYNASKKSKNKNPKKYGPGTPYMLASYCRSRLYIAFKKYSIFGKITSSKQYDIDWHKVIKHLIETLPKDFDEWNKNNPNNPYSIDHIYPLSKFNLEDLEQVKIAFAPENHQWLKLKDNISKGNKLDWIKV